MPSNTAEMSREQLEARVRELETKRTRTQTLSFKVSAKGAVSVYGMGKFPVTLYSSQWDRLFTVIPALQEFLAEHASELSVKADTAEAVAA